MKKTYRNALLAAAGLGAIWALRQLKRKASYFDLKDRVVLITGGSRGLGLALARELAREGARLAICARTEAQLERARQELAATGAQVLAQVCDVTDQAQVLQLVKRITTELGPVEVLINNAGVIQVGPLEEMVVKDYDEAMRIHFWAPLYTMLAVVPGMRQRKEGRVVNISSVGGRMPVVHLAPYSASKFALFGLSEGFRAELKQHNVLVSTVCPGLFRSGSTLNAWAKGRHQQEYAVFATLDMLPFTSMDPDRLARQIVDALKHGDAQLTTTLPATLAASFHGLFPGLFTDISALVNELLPKPGGIGRHRASGFESRSDLVPEFVRKRVEEAARKYNEL